MRTDGVSVGEMVWAMGDDDGTSSGRAGCAPFEWMGLDLTLVGLIDKGCQGGAPSVKSYVL